ncbi:MAG: hypothetical protein CSA44_01150 [Gammaproteobacteria bacterium]|nr:MAG: hypothetical protein CSA44_01150 [Gammaproteobacteria bacterium]
MAVFEILPSTASLVVETKLFHYRITGLHWFINYFMLIRQKNAPLLQAGLVLILRLLANP